MKVEVNVLGSLSLIVPNSPHSLCGRKATLNLNHISSQSSGAVRESVSLGGKALGVCVCARACMRVCV